MASTFLRFAAAGAAGVLMTAPAFGADYSEPQVIEYEIPAPAARTAEPFGGWYLRGDVAYRHSKYRGGEYIRYDDPVPPPGFFDFGDLKGSYSIGGGVGYQINRHLRTDVTLDWFGKSDFRGQTTGVCGPDQLPCSSTDRSAYSAWLLLANAYVDLGTWNKITPYVGAGIGGAWVKWDSLRNLDDNGETGHNGGKGWRFAYSLMAGASYCLTQNWHADLGYRFTHIQGGRMFGYANNAGPGWDKGLFTHEARAGLRYQFGGAGDRCGDEQLVYIPPEPYSPPPVYK